MSINKSRSQAELLGTTEEEGVAMTGGVEAELLAVSSEGEVSQEEDCEEEEEE